MEFNIKTTKPKKTTHPKVGDIKQKIGFALFPTNVDGKILWLEKYIKVMKYKEMQGIEEIEVTSGLLEDAITATGLMNTRYFTRHYTYCSWVCIRKEFIK